MSRRVCETVRAGKQSRNFRLRDDLLGYIDQHFDDNQLSIATLADRFAVSGAYLCRYFKDQVGKTVLEYVNERRFSRAKALLRDSDLPLKRIVGLIGLSDISSFIRKFRRIEGMTPGQYRDLAAAASRPHLGPDIEVVTGRTGS